MPDLKDGESIEVQGSARAPYVLRNVGGVYSCSCPAWRNQSVAIERRTCKHLRALRGEAAERERIGSALPQSPIQKASGPSSGDGDEATSDKAPALLLAHTWENDADLSGWWMSEKLDGVRAYWDGTQFVSRQGNIFHAPDWFVAGLPREPLDGELWLGRKAFQRTVSIVRRQDKSDHWKEIRYLVFDMPSLASPFEERVEELRERLGSARPEFAAVHEHQLCRDVEHLREELARVESLGGEGMMLRQPGSRYEAGRSTTLLKVKTFHDAEARVIGHHPGAGRHKGRLGALEVQLPDGTEFSVGTGFSDAERSAPPAVGDVITFRYQELSDRGVPRFPSFIRVHPDGATAPPKRAKAANSSSEVQRAANKITTTPTVSTSTTSSTEATAARRFEFIEGPSAKFWEIAVLGCDVTVRFGRIGAEGQRQTKSFSDPAAAQRHGEKLIAEKESKGYVEK